MLEVRSFWSLLLCMGTGRKSSVVVYILYNMIIGIMKEPQEVVDGWYRTLFEITSPDSYKTIRTYKLVNLIGDELLVHPNRSS